MQNVDQQTFQGKEKLLLHQEGGLLNWLVHKGVSLDALKAQERARYALVQEDRKEQGTARMRKTTSAVQAFTGS